MKYWLDEKTGLTMSEPDCCDEWLWMLWAVGCDYDGMDGSVESMKELVDELVEIASKARACLYKGELFAETKER